MLITEKDDTKTASPAGATRLADETNPAGATRFGDAAILADKASPADAARHPTAPSSPTAAIQLLAVDLDDTLLKEDLSISEGNLRALKAAEDLGVSVLLASGRVPEAMSRYARELDMHRRPGYIISNNGCTIHRSDTGEELYRRSIDGEAAVDIYRRAQEAGFPVERYRGSFVCTNRENSWTDLDSSLSGLGKKIIPEFEEELRVHPPVKLIIPGEPDLVARFREELTEDYGDAFTIFISKPYFLEVLPKGADKGVALAWLAEKLSVPREAVMAIGDSDNDLGMVEWAGRGIAMANANEPVKAAASWITIADHEHDGVAEAVERFILVPHASARDPLGEA